MARLQLPESRLRTRRQSRRVLTAALLFLLACLLFAAAALLAHAPFLRISEVQVFSSPAQKASLASSTEEFIRREISGSYLFFFPKNNVLLYPRGSVEQNLRAQYPELAEVHIRARSLTTLDVAITPREPAALWCGRSIASSSPCVILDESGFAYALAPTFSIDVYIRFYGAGTESVPFQFLTPQDFRVLVALTGAVAHTAAKPVQEVAIDANNDVALRLRDGFTLNIALADAGGDAFERFALALASDAFKNKKLSDFEYLDLRFDDKLYYKLR